MSDWHRVLDQHREWLKARIERAHQRTWEAAAARRRGLAHVRLSQALELQEVQAELDALRRLAPPEEQAPTYATSAWFLEDCFRELNQGPNESMHFVTGPQLGDTRVLDRMVTFEMDKQNPVYVSGDMKATHAALMEMEHRGHQLAGWFHIHPGRGAGATQPSGIDLATQRRFEAGGYPVIGAIFSRDGFVRFFAVANRVDVAVFGAGAEQVEEHVWHIAHVD